VSELPEISDEERAYFLAYVAEHPSCSIREAAEMAGRRRWEFRALLGEEEFEAAYLEARGRDPEQIRAELRRRAIEGIDEPVFYQGEEVTTVKKYSDSLLGKMADAYLPEFSRQGSGDGNMDGAMIAVERRVVVGIRDVVGLARELGVSLDGELDRGSPRGELPAASPLLPDPAGD
jgi:hypothetical protein